jgi:CubicO group peptidase (beta-lactamase class C family)
VKSWKILLRAMLVCIFDALLVLTFVVSGAARADNVDDYVNDEIQTKHIPAIAIVVLKDGTVVKERAYGTANLEFGVAAHLSDIFPLASITKLFSAVAVFLLVQDGKLHLDDKVTSLLSGLPSSWSHVTVLNCLSHTSGIPDFPQIYDSATVPATEKEAVAVVASRPMVYATGTKSAYNQTEFLLLKIIVEKVSGMKFSDFLNGRIFAPAGITSARYGDSRDILPQGVSVYTRADPAPDRFHSIPLRPFVNRATDPLFHSDLFFPSYTRASAGLNMTAPDLARLDTALHRGLLSTALLRQMWMPYKLKNGSLGDFTAGWQYDDWNGHRVVGHIGAGMAAYTSLVDDHVTLVLLTNVQETKVWDISRGLLHLYVPGVAKH